MTNGEKIKRELGLGSKLSIINLVQFIVEEAFDARASDIHIDPSNDALLVRYRVDGLLRLAHCCPKNIHQEVISRIKILAGMRTDEHMTPQDGRFRILAANNRPVDVRVSIVPTYFGENAVLRLLSDNEREFTLDSLGFSSDNAKKIMRCLNRPHGMILVTGPTGSGKTTTLYTLVKMLNTGEACLVSVEDPIEYSIEGVGQIQVNPRAGLTFASGLKAILRQDPNIVMVGEIRDTETAGLAVNTALTGHLLLSTLHTTDAATALPRLLDLKVEGYLIASTINVVIGQRLVRRLCSSCKFATAVTPAECEGLLEFLPMRAARNFGLGKFYSAKGCESCGFSGYSGRIGIHEVLILTPGLKEAVLNKCSAGNLRKLAIQSGMVPLIADGLEKARAGITSLQEILTILHE